MRMIVCSIIDQMAKQGQAVNQGKKWKLEARKPACAELAVANIHVNCSIWSIYSGTTARAKRVTLTGADVFRIVSAPVFWANRIAS
jgi:hypothetical protein